MPDREAHQALPAELGVEPLTTLRPLPSEVEYPESDGQPLADNAFQGRTIVSVGSALRLYFRDRDDVLVDCDMLVYYQKDEPAKCVAPEVFVVRGVACDPEDVTRRAAPKGTGSRRHRAWNGTRLRASCLSRDRCAVPRRSRHARASWLVMPQLSRA